MVVSDHKQKPSKNKREKDNQMKSGLTFELVPSSDKTITRLDKQFSRWLKH